MGSSQSKKLAALAKGKQPSKSHEKQASVPELGRDGGWKMKGRKAGAGATASVRVIYREGHPKKYAVKMFLRRYKETSSEYKKRVGKEFDIAVRLQHENLLRTFHQGQKKGTLYFVMEYCSAGDLFDLIQKYNLRWEHKKRLLKQLLRGVKYLHDHGIAHRDIKPENIVMADPNCLKICDFGDAVVFRETNASDPSSAEGGKGTESIQLCSSRALGTKGYHPPEFAGEQPYDPRHLDVWCVGLTCLFLFVEGYAWELADPEEDSFYEIFDAGWRAFRLIHQDRIPTDAHYPVCSGCFRCLDDSEPGLRTLIFRMVDPNPATRITIDDALNSPWVQGIEC